MEKERVRRTKNDKFGRNAALERLKNLKQQGSKNKYKVSNLDNVYDTVDEREYSKKVLERQDDDWIVDDGSGGYVEDGREIFDDDLDTESVETARKHKTHNRKSLKKDTNSKGSIQHMIAKMNVKKKDEISKIDDDNILSDLISDLDAPPKPQVTIKKKIPNEEFSIYNPKAAKDYLKKLHDITNLKTMTKSNLEQANSETVIEEVSSPILQSYSEDIDIKPVISQQMQEKVSTESVMETENIPTAVTQNSADLNKKEIKIEDTCVSLESSNKKSTVTIKEQHMDCDSVHKLSDGKDENDKIFAEGWGDFDEDLILDNEQLFENIDTSNITVDKLLAKDGIDSKVMSLFWWDIYEDPFKPGVVYIFGKTYVAELKKYVNCCVSVKNIERKVFILPNPFVYNKYVEDKDVQKSPVSMVDVYNEINSNYTRGVKIRTRTVSKRYCFAEPENVPEEAEYLEVRYPANKGKLFSPVCSGQTFNYVFGTNTNILETFLLDRKIKGPCWLEIKNFHVEGNPVSWCNLEIYCDSMVNINVAAVQNDPPPIVIATMNSCILPNENTQEHEIVMMSCLMHSNYNINKNPPNPPYETHFCAISRPSGQSWPLGLNEALKNYKKTKVQKCDSERELINYWLTVFQRTDPDFIIGHDLVGYQLDTLLHRMRVLKINGWSRLGRLRRNKMPDRIRNIQLDAVPGRSVCDLKILAKELIKSRSFDLATLSTSVLNIKEENHRDFQENEIREMFTSAKSIFELIFYTMQDAAYILRIIFKLNALPLALQIANITGFVLSKTFLGGRSERNEYLLLHAFTEKNFIAPDKREMKKKTDESSELTGGSKRKKAAYAGGLVLEPVIGFYDKLILLMDFNSLYPSIIQEYNVCFTTANRLISEITFNDSEPGILPTEIRKLVESRKQIKNLMKNSDLSSDKNVEYNIRQTALKLTANSMYGCLGFSGSRFYEEALAAYITSKGREILMNTKDLVIKLNHEVIYGDTDSLMINTKINEYNQVFKIGQAIKKAVNKLYKKVELDIDGVFRYLLLLKKKKYAAVTVTKNKKGELIYEKEIKGLDIVRRDWSQLAAEAGKVVLDYILSDLDEDDRISLIQEHLSKLKLDLEKNVIPVSLLTITKQLTRDPALYANSKSLPHVQVAIKFNSKGGKRLRRGDMVPYVIVEDGSNLPAMQRAYHVDDLKNNPALKIDINYYLSQQILPLVSRLCEPLEGLEMYQIAEALGLCGNAFKRKPIVENMQIENYTNKSTYVDCESFSFTCTVCETVNNIREPFRKCDTDSDIPTSVLDACINKECKKCPMDYIKYIHNRLQLTIQKYIQKYYNSKLICEDPACINVYRNIPKSQAHSKKVFCSCNTDSVMTKEYTDKDLYTQIRFFCDMFDLKNVKNKSSMSGETIKGFDMLHNLATHYLNRSLYCIINLDELFSFLALDAR